MITIDISKVRASKASLARKNLKKVDKAKKELLRLQDSFKDSVLFNMCFIGLDNLKSIYNEELKQLEELGY